MSFFKAFTNYNMAIFEKSQIVDSFPTPARNLKLNKKLEASIEMYFAF